MAEERRWCYYVSGMHRGTSGNMDGFIPSIVTEGEPGHRLLRGDPKKHQAPWVWGPTLDDAQDIADHMNEKIGLTPQEANEIITSSMRASNELAEKSAEQISRNEGGIA